MDYTIVRHIHIACAAITVILFATRGCLALVAIDWRRWRPLRWLPHLTDTVLLAAAIALAIMSRQFPFQQPWLTAKLGALVVYVGLGRQALRPGLTRRQCLPWLVGALVAVAYIVAVAITKQPLPW